MVHIKEVCNHLLLQFYQSNQEAKLWALGIHCHFDIIKWNANSNKYFQYFKLNPAGNYMFKVNNRNSRTRCETCSKLTIKTPERRHCHRSDVFIVNFEHISYLVLVFLLLNLSRLG